LGLYINKNKHPDVYKNNENVDEPNQVFIKTDNLSTFIDEQIQANVSINRVLEEMKKQFIAQGVVQTSNWDNVSSQLKEIRNNNLLHYQSEEQFIDWIKVLDEKNSRLQESNEQLATKIIEQIELQKHLSQEFTKQEEFHTEVLSRLDKQEALTEKIYRQLNHIRSILFERTNYLAEKMDEGYKLTSSYVYNLMIGNDQPVSFTLLNRNKKVEKL
jgi:GMP synthase PP-ATPase subunit